MASSNQNRVRRRMCVGVFVRGRICVGVCVCGRICVGVCALTFELTFGIGLYVLYVGTPEDLDQK